PRAPDARGAATAPPRGATARHTSGRLWSRPQPSSDPRPPPPPSPGAWGPATGGRPARPWLAPRRGGPLPGHALPTTPVAGDAPRPPSPPPPRRPARPRPTPAPASAVPAAAGWHRGAPAAGRRARHVPRRPSMRGGDPVRA